MSAAFARRTWRSPDGLTLAVRDYPGADGPARAPVICLHGLTRNARDFEDAAPWIAARGRRVLVPDMRGRGGSARDPDPRRYAVPVYAGDVAALLDQAGIAKAVFVGTSMGGLITLGLSALRPDAIAAAVLNDIGPVIDPAGLARIAAYAGKSAPVTDWAGAAARAREVNAHAFPHYDAGDWTRFARRTFREGPDGRPVQDYDPAIVQGLGGPVDAAAAAALWPLYNGLAALAPVLVIRGERSDLLSAETAAAMASAGRDVRLAVVPGVGHAPMLDEAASQAALADILSRAP